MVLLHLYLDKYPRLLPSDKSSEMYRKVQDFTEHFTKLNVPVFTYGTMNNEELRKGVRLPQFVMKKRLQGEWDVGAGAAESALLKKARRVSGRE